MAPHITSFLNTDLKGSLLTGSIRGFTLFVYLSYEERFDLPFLHNYIFVLILSDNGNFYFLHNIMLLNKPHYQYSKTNVMHFSFNLIRIKDLYMFRGLFAHPQEALHNDT
jgi:hypothetical protein